MSHTSELHETPPCGCIGLGPAIHFCPLHAAAPDLRAACEAIVKTDAKRVGVSENPHELYLTAVRLARAALAKMRP